MPTDEQLEAMAPHVVYEVIEFRKSKQALSRMRPTSPEWNRTLESLLLHFRILRSFFFEEGRWKDDLWAVHYIKGWKPPRDPIFDGTRSELDKRLAHLTLGRLTPIAWNAEAMSTAIEILVSDFKNSLQPRQAGWFSRLQATSTITLSKNTSYGTQS